MMNQWQAFLAEQTREAEQRPASDCQLFDLSHLGLISARGADADTFLQGQLTNDVRELSPTRSQLSAHCSHKGRVMAVFRLIRREDGIYLQTAADRVAEILKRLGMYVLRSKVTLADVGDECLRMGLAGEEAPRRLSDLGMTVPERNDEVASADGLTLIRLPGPIPRFEILGAFDRLRPLWERLTAHAGVADADRWRLLDIQAGLPSVYAQSTETFVPQMLNLHLIDGVSFNKGCYTGQEVVARMQFLGKLKRRMYLAEADLETRPAPGEHLFSSDSTSQQSSGWIVDAAPLSEGRFAILAVAEIAAAEGGAVRLGEEGPTLDLQPPPYGFAD
ncbi:CAF17-like 4Fe-4S cluster assembly/insertion protein YgfZ [Imhoffiella purpurea]|uniref:Folate-dependent protein for Fe/S cluster synthesis/repair in oxidative stress n=1 Tax=Imhoffiella purpurea TaxID=1249627 RepID=W9VEL8_9GAMM|nr:folate-binding protein YgfZ [Imhoffiella purpurea]EXJ14487.1 Folate-dependent protein for Fe/S cluster synthesis/repair in oxidative stress [Imhoffiella purpurea]